MSFVKPWCKEQSGRLMLFIYLHPSTHIFFPSYLTQFKCHPSARRVNAKNTLFLMREQLWGTDGGIHLKTAALAGGITSQFL